MAAGAASSSPGHHDEKNATSFWAPVWQLPEEKEQRHKECAVTSKECTVTPN